MAGQTVLHNGNTKNKQLNSYSIDVAGHLSYGRVSNSSPNGYLWVGLSQKYQQAFFTSRIRPAELRRSVPRRVRFPFAFGGMINLVRTDLYHHLGCEDLTCCLLTIC
ncbi:uncharacterized protein NPIL_682041 [Nephila pilipes]|uniref:Uncharacterized protein n=1 Tax=Nephila pilipes TaxID=299642 RepID=A0A8X6R1S0_NEPPI|nr:uncharacterized protein NPIL_682041 [Nephila pilipes]